MRARSPISLAAATVSSSRPILAAAPDLRLRSRWWPATPTLFGPLHGEGGGGDYVRVAWRISTDATPAPSLSPIPGIVSVRL